ncbi:MAG: hypothetical protein WBM07_17090 [Chitinivibrionales bacterium]
MEQFLLSLTQYGALGIVAGASLYSFIKLSNRLLGVIESNTRAMERLSGIIDTCQKLHAKE